MDSPRGSPRSCVQWLVTDLGAEFPQFLSQIKGMSAEAEAQRNSGGLGCGGDEGRIQGQPAHSACRLQPGASDCLCQYRQPAAGAGIGPAHSNSSSTRTGSFEEAPDSPVAHGERRALGHGRRSGNRDCLSGGKAHCCAGIPICELRSDRRDTFAACIGLRLWRCLWSLDCCSARRLRGSHRMRNLRRPCEVRIGARATSRRCRRSRWSWCRPRCRLSCLPAPGC